MVIRQRARQQPMIQFLTINNYERQIISGQFIRNNGQILGVGFLSIRAFIIFIYIVQTMQVNCCIFPAPSDFSYNKKNHEILLIPKHTQPDRDKPYQFYHEKCLGDKPQGNNQFDVFLSTRMKLKKSAAITNDTCKDISDINVSKYSSENYPLKSSQAYLVSSNDNSEIVGKILPKVSSQIPCLFILGSDTNKIIVMFHGNGEDISSSYDFAAYISKQFGLSVLLMEYMGYSVYKGSPNPKNIISDAQRVVQFLRENGVANNEIVLFGRSIGGGIAFQLAALIEPIALILLSPFLSLKKIAEDLYGKSASCLLKESLNNENVAGNVKCPIMLVHGLKDTLVPYQHSIGILNSCKSYTRLKLAQNMTHTKFNFRTDFMLPVRQFLIDMEIIGKHSKE